MTALSAGLARPQQHGEGPIPTEQSYGVAASTVCYQGGLAVHSTGYAKPGTTTTSLIQLGVFAETVDNSAGSAGAKNVRVKAGVFRFANGSSSIGIADVGNDCYIVDDSTVHKTNGSSTRSRAGKIQAVDSDGVWVLVAPGL